MKPSKNPKKPVGATLPKVDKIKRPFYWLPIETALRADSIDFLNGLTKSNLTSKRQDKGYRKLRDNIKREGFRYPIYNDGKYQGNGHHRLAAAVGLGYTHVPATNNYSDEYAHISDGDDDWTSP